MMCQGASQEIGICHAYLAISSLSNQTAPDASG